MLKIVFAMLIGIALGATVTHELMSPEPSTPADRSGTPPAADESTPLPAQAPTSDRAGVPSAIAPQRDFIVGGGSVRAAIETSLDGRRDIGVSRIAGIDPAIAEAASFADAFEHALSLRGDTPGFLRALVAVAARWLSAAPTDAIAALDRLSAPDARQTYIEALVRTAVIDAPERLVDCRERSGPRSLSHRNARIESDNGARALSGR